MLGQLGPVSPSDVTEILTSFASAMASFAVFAGSPFFLGRDGVAGQDDAFITTILIQDDLGLPNVRGTCVFGESSAELVPRGRAG